MVVIVVIVILKRKNYLRALPKQNWVIKIKNFIVVLFLPFYLASTVNKNAFYGWMVTIRGGAEVDPAARGRGDCATSWRRSWWGPKGYYKAWWTALQVRTEKEENWLIEH